MVKYAKFLDEFNRIKQTSKVIDYLDENGKIVMFRGNEKRQDDGNASCPL